MESDFKADNLERTPISDKSQAFNTTEPAKGQDTNGEPQNVPERLERVEAALGMVLDHLQTVTKGSEILDAARTRNMLSSIALGISAVALIAFASIASTRPEISIDISRFSIGMAMLFLAAVLDLASGMLLQRAINGAIFRKDPTLLNNWQGPWHRFLRLNYWTRLKKTSIAAFYYQAVRGSAFAVYLMSGILMIWAVFSL